MLERGRAARRDRRCARSRSRSAAPAGGCCAPAGVWVADGDGPRPLHPVHRGRRARRGARARPSARSGREVLGARPSDGVALGARAPGRPRGARCDSRLPPSDRSRSSSRPRASRCGSRSSGTGARRSASSASARATAPQLDQAGRTVQLGADRRYTGPGLPAGDARRGRDPAGRLRAGAVAALEPRLRRPGSRPTPTAPGSTSPASGSSVSTRARTPARCALRAAVRPHPGRAPARVLPADRLPGAAARVGLRLLEEPRRPRAPGRRARRLRRLSPARDPARRDRDRLAVGDAIQHLGVQPPPVPRRAGDDLDACAPTACARCCGSRRGSTSTRATARSRPSRSPSACTASRRRTTRRAPPPGTSSASAERRAVRRPSGGWGPGSPVDFTSPAAEEWWREQAKRVLALGVEGIKADDGDGYYIPDDVALADGRTRRRRRPGRSAGCTALRCSARSTRSTPAPGVLFGRSGWTGPAGDRPDLGRRSGVGLLVAAGARGGDADAPPAAASRTGPTTSAATSATAWSSAARPSCSSAGSSSAASRR